LLHTVCVVLTPQWKVRSNFSWNYITGKRQILIFYFCHAWFWHPCVHVCVCVCVCAYKVVWVSQKPGDVLLVLPQSWMMREVDWKEQISVASSIHQAFPQQHFDTNWLGIFLDSGQFDSDSKRETTKWNLWYHVNNIANLLVLILQIFKKQISHFPQESLTFPLSIQCFQFSLATLSC